MTHASWLNFYTTGKWFLSAISNVREFSELFLYISLNMYLPVAFAYIMCLDRLQLWIQEPAFLLRWCFFQNKQVSYAFKTCSSWYPLTSFYSIIYIISIIVFIYWEYVPADLWSPEADSWFNGDFMSFWIYRTSSYLLRIYCHFLNQQFCFYLKISKLITIFFWFSIHITNTLPDFFLNFRSNDICVKFVDELCHTSPDNIFNLLNCVNGWIINFKLSADFYGFLSLVSKTNIFFLYCRFSPL